MRKIIQIAVDSQPGSEYSTSWECLTALCDDGTVWEYSLDNGSGRMMWKQIPPIPQDRSAWGLEND